MIKKALKQKFEMGDHVLVHYPEVYVAGMEIINQQDNLVRVKSYDKFHNEHPYFMGLNDSSDKLSMRFEVKGAEGWTTPTDVPSMLGKTIRPLPTDGYVYRYHPTKSGKRILELNTEPYITRRPIVEESMLEKIEGPNLALKAISKQGQKSYIDKRAEWDKDLRVGEEAMFRESVVLLADITKNPLEEKSLGYEDGDLIVMFVMNPITREIQTLNINVNLLMIRNTNGDTDLVTELYKHDTSKFEFEKVYSTYRPKCEQAYLYIPETKVEITEVERTRVRVVSELFCNRPRYISKSFIHKIN